MDALSASLKGRASIEIEGLTIAYGRHQAPARAGIGGPDGVDTAVELQQLMSLEHLTDLARAQPGREELPTGDHAMLPRRDLGHDLPPRRKLTFHSNAKLRRGRNSPPYCCSLLLPAPAARLEVDHQRHSLQRVALA